MTGPGRDVPGVFLEGLCNSTSWPGPPEQRTDRLAITETLSDWEVTRELVTYDTEEHARAVVSRLRDDLGGCPAAEGQPVTTYDAETGFDSLTYGTPVEGTTDGRTLVQVVRAGRAVLATSQFTDPSSDDVQAAVDELTGDLTPVTTEMACHWRTGGCGPYAEGFTLRPDAGEPFELGMTVEEARNAALNVRIDNREVCPQLSWTDRLGEHVHGAFSPGIGLAYISTDRGGTTEGAKVGDTLAQLQRVYPNLESYGTGGSDSFLSDQGDTAYVFDLDGNRDMPRAQDRHITLIMVIADDQRCAS